MIHSKRKSLKDFAGLYLRGIAMGAADLVPGVSGGTIALITGIYDELLGSISAIHPHGRGNLQGRMEIHLDCHQW